MFGTDLFLTGLHQFFLQGTLSGLSHLILIVLIWKRQLEGPETVPRLHREQIIQPELKLSHLTLEGLLLTTTLD